METKSKPGLEILPSVKAAVLATLDELRTAQEAARDLGRPASDFALDIGVLCAAGSTENALRWLIGKGYLDQRIETTIPGAPERSFVNGCPYSFTQRSCFLLTTSGMVLVENALIPIPATTVTTDPVPKPRWDAAAAELWVGDTLVKSYRRPAANQELILQAFEELGWPTQLDDPLAQGERIKPPLNSSPTGCF